MSDMRDTLILPCRHLCLCQSCADSLRYQANNCPICRVPFRALLQIKALQKTLDNNHRVINSSLNIFKHDTNVMLLNRQKNFFFSKNFKNYKIFNF